MTKSKKNVIVPFINFKENRVSFPLLNDVGLSEYDVKFLESLSTESVGVLEKKVYERQLVCPKHPDELSTGIRLYCPDCSSMDVERLHLIEHKVCGFIAEKEKYGVEDVRQVQKCPHCKKQIEDFKKEIRLPGRWNKCNSCSKIFDNVIIKLHCRKFAHDFEITEVESIPIPSYSLKSNSLENVGIMAIIAPIKKILISVGYEVEELAKIKGNSGVEHPTSLFARGPNDKTIVVFVKSSRDEIADSEINATLVKVLDIAPSETIFVAIPSLSDAAKSTAEAHGMNVIIGKSEDDIISGVRKILSKEVSTVDSSNEIPLSSDQPKKIT